VDAVDRRCGGSHIKYAIFALSFPDALPPPPSSIRILPLLLDKPPGSLYHLPDTSRVSSRPTISPLHRCELDRDIISRPFHRYNHMQFFDLFTMNVFRILADLSHLASIFGLIYTIRRSKSSSEISLKTQCLLALVSLTRYTGMPP
jgi:hypothetical protein